jgi:hypothetical protein
MADQEGGIDMALLDRADVDGAIIADGNNVGIARPKFCSMALLGYHG